MELTVIWIIGIIAFVILESLTYQIVSIWFALGAIGGLIATAMGANFTVQMIVFLVVSVVFLICLRPVSMKLLKPRGAKTNVDNVIGKEVLITKQVDNIQGIGEGKLGGMVWAVRSSDDSVIQENEKVIVEKVEGVKLIVKREGA